MKFRRLPIGIEDFSEMIEQNYYYADKTWLIRDLWMGGGKVTLFTRPRRFGKTLNLSMLRYFYEDTRDAEQNQRNSALFKGLKIMDAEPQLLKMQCGFPVINLSLKSAKQPDFDLSMALLKRQIAGEFRRHAYLCSEAGGRAGRFERIMNETGSMDDYADALAFLSELLWKHFGRKAVILIDEYDVPLENSYFCGFYDRMVSFIRSLFESALKTNPALEFAVITGCLRISRESIFTGLNNLRMNSILDSSYGVCFWKKEVIVLRSTSPPGSR